MNTEMTPETEVEGRRVLSSAEQQIIAEWTELNAGLTEARAKRAALGDKIRGLVAQRTVKARLVRVIDPSLLKPESNGD